MEKFEEGQMNLFDTQLYYKIIGEGLPILMLHGWGVDHHLMTGCMELIFQDQVQQYKRIYIDLPGMGKSKASDTIRSSDDVLELILAFIDQVIPNQKFILVGESYGGYLARFLVHRKRDSILGLLLICPLVYPGYRRGEVPEKEVLERDMFLLNELEEQERSFFEYITIVQNRSVWNRFRSSIYDALVESKDNYFLNHILDGSFTYDIDDVEEPFDKPSLILVGRQDTEVGYKDQFKLLENYPRASYVVLDKAGHNLQIEQEELFIYHVLEWLQRIHGDLSRIN